MVMEDTLLLRPLVHPVVCEFLQQRALLFELMRALGSPLNIKFPELIGNNVNSYQGVFDKYCIQGRINFAHKATQSASLVKQAAVMNKLSLDIASANELKSGLAAGFAGSRMEATGPKSSEFLLLCLLHDVVINVDDISEIEQVIALRRKLGRTQKTKILLRLAGFSSTTTAALTKSSRFGIPLPLGELQAVLTVMEQYRDELDLRGLSFHLNSRSIQERVVAIDCCASLFYELVDRDFSPQVLNIGGGYGINYLAYAADWDNYVRALQESILGTRSPMTWQGTSFGMSVDKGVLRGTFSSYDYYRTDVGAPFLNELLSSQLPAQGMTVAQFLKSNGIQLWIEPGHSMLDQCGITVGAVTGLRRASRGEQIVTLALNRQDVVFLDQEVFVDPIIVYQDGEPSGDTQPVPVYFAGNLCQESDMVTKHLTWLRRLPKRGDLIVFPNTAAYFSDFSATTAIMQPVARQVAVWQKSDSYHWTLDDQYSPI